jgi:hypothetical protein
MIKSNTFIKFEKEEDYIKYKEKAIEYISLDDDGLTIYYKNQPSLSESVLDIFIKELREKKISFEFFLSNKLTDLVIDYCEENKEEFLNLTEYYQEDYKKNKYKSRVPSYKNKVELSSIEFFDNLSKFIYKKIIEDNEIEINLKNHIVRDGTKLKDMCEDGIYKYSFNKENMTDYILDRVARIAEAYLTPKNNHDLMVSSMSLVMGEEMKIMETVSCDDCGELIPVILDLGTNKMVMASYARDKKEECQIMNYKDKIYFSGIKITSGKIVLLNNIMPFLKKTEKSKINKTGSINSFIGMQKYIKEMENNNMLYAPLTNGSPTVLFIDNEIILTTDSENMEYKKEEEKGYISTGVWGFFGLDYDEFIRKIKLSAGQDLEDFIVIELENGEYSMKGYNDMEDNKFPYSVKITKK